MYAYAVHISSQKCNQDTIVACISHLPFKYTGFLSWSLHSKHSKHVYNLVIKSKVARYRRALLLWIVPKCTIGSTSRYSPYTLAQFYVFGHWCLSMILYPAGKIRGDTMGFSFGSKTFLCDYVEDSIFGILFKRATFGHFGCVFERGAYSCSFSKSITHSAERYLPYLDAPLGDAAALQRDFF